MNAQTIRSMLAFFSFFICFILYANQSFSSELSFHRVLRHCNDCSLNLYYEGKSLFKNYPLMGMDDDFLIEKRPDIVFEKYEIESIKIEKVNFLPNEPESYTISFKFSPKGALKLERYTANNKGKLISVQIDDTVIQLATIIETLRDGLSLPLSTISPAIAGKLEVLAGKNKRGWSKIK